MYIKRILVMILLATATFALPQVASHDSWNALYDQTEQMLKDHESTTTIANNIKELRAHANTFGGKSYLNKVERLNNSLNVRRALDADDLKEAERIIKIAGMARAPVLPEIRREFQMAKEGGPRVSTAPTPSAQRAPTQPPRPITPAKPETIEKEFPIEQRPAIRPPSAPQPEPSIPEEKLQEFIGEREEIIVPARRKVQKRPELPSGKPVIPKTIQPTASSAKLSHQTALLNAYRLVNYFTMYDAGETTKSVMQTIKNLFESSNETLINQVKTNPQIISNPESPISQEVRTIILEKLFIPEPVLTQSSQDIERDKHRAFAQSLIDELLWQAIVHNKSSAFSKIVSNLQTDPKDLRYKESQDFIAQIIAQCGKNNKQLLEDLETGVGLWQKFTATASKLWSGQMGQLEVLASDDVLLRPKLYDIIQNLITLCLKSVTSEVTAANLRAEQLRLYRLLTNLEKQQQFLLNDTKELIKHKSINLDEFQRYDTLPQDKIKSYITTIQHIVATLQNHVVPDVMRLRYLQRRVSKNTSKTIGDKSSFQVLFDLFYAFPKESNYKILERYHKLYLQDKKEKAEWAEIQATALETILTPILLVSGAALAQETPAILQSIASYVRGEAPTLQFTAKDLQPGIDTPTATTVADRLNKGMEEYSALLKNMEKTAETGVVLERIHQQAEIQAQQREATFPLVQELAQGIQAGEALEERAQQQPSAKPAPVSAYSPGGEGPSL